MVLSPEVEVVYAELDVLLPVDSLQRDIVSSEDVVSTELVVPCTTDMFLEIAQTDEQLVEDTSHQQVGCTV